MASETSRSQWPPGLPLDHPCWTDHRQWLALLAGPIFPDCAAFNRLLPNGLTNAAGHRLRFVASTGLAPGPYEQRIFNSGRISTRADNWHDLFNALCWLCLPRTKVAMNAMHCQPQADVSQGSRGRQRDALTLFDECGLIVASPDRDVLEALSNRCWLDVFARPAAYWQERVTLVVAGHALLEKCLRPYKAMTANAVLLNVPESLHGLPRARRVSALDRLVADAMLGPGLLGTPAMLSPLPVMGLPGWWIEGRQDGAFYADTQVFRPLRREQSAAPVHDLRRIS